MTTHPGQPTPAGFQKEAGSPNTPGAVTLGVVCRTLQAADMGRLTAAEADLIDLARTGLATIPGLRQYRLWPL